MDVDLVPVLVRGGIVVRRMPVEAVAELLEALDAAEVEADGPLVDESERLRLTRLAATVEERGVGALQPDPEDPAADPLPGLTGWHPLVAVRGVRTVGYAAVVADGDRANGDATPLAADPTRSVLGSLLAAQRVLAHDLGVRALQVWVRQAGQRDIDVAEVEDYTVERRLGVLGRSLGATVEPAEPSGHTIRAYRPDHDDDGVVEVLAGAYEGTEEAGWDLDRLREREQQPWFRAEDLLVAVSDTGAIDGLHWTKRHDASRGEVYNLAVHPRAQGAGLGPALLAAGLEHLRAVGCDEVVLWVDRANEAAVALYERAGFTTRWDDVALRAAPGGP